MLIELRDVWKSFGSNDILRGCNIKIRRGEAVGIIGGSGTGKSTTLRIMAGLLEPDRVRQHGGRRPKLRRTLVFRGPPSSPQPAPHPRPRCVPTLRLAAQGEVRILGQPRQGLLADDAELAARLSVGMVFQNGALFDSLTVGENVGFLLYEHTRLPDRRIRVRSSGAPARRSTRDNPGSARRASHFAAPLPGSHLRLQPAARAARTGRACWGRARGYQGGTA